MIKKIFYFSLLFIVSAFYIQAEKVYPLLLNTSQPATHSYSTLLEMTASHSSSSFLILVGLVLGTAGAGFMICRYKTKQLRQERDLLVQKVSNQALQLREKNEEVKLTSKKLDKLNLLLDKQHSNLPDDSVELKTQIENLRQKNSELLRLISTRNKMFAIISHDLRSPFNTILGFTGLLTESFDATNSERMKQYARHIHDASLSVFNLLENLLCWSKSQTKQIQFNPSLTDLDEIVEDSLLLVRESAVRKNQIIDTSDYKNHQVYVDADMMRSVVRNLIINAIKFTPSEGVIKITSFANTEKVTVSISDTGIGMSQDLIDQISRNLTVDSAPGTSGEKGSGLGLTLAFEFIEMNGGELNIESTLGKGSTFSFTLPLKATS